MKKNQGKEITEEPDYLGYLLEYQSELDNLRGFINYVTESIEHKKKSLNHPPPHGIDEMTGGNIERFPWILTASFIVSLVIFMEEHLRCIAKALRKFKGMKLDISDFNGSLFKKFKIYVTKYADIDSPFIGKVNWDGILEIFTLRNCIIHHGKCLTGFKYDDQIKRFAVDGPFGEDKYISLNKQNCLDCLKTVEIFIKSFYDYLSQKFPEYYHLPASSQG